MDFNIRDDLPIYSQVVAQIKAGIASGAISPGDRIPSAREMAADAGVNPNTIQRAMQELERDGVIYTQRTAGRFVTDDIDLIATMKHQLADDKIRQFLHTMAELGFTEEETVKMISFRIQEDKTNGST